MLSVASLLNPIKAEPRGPGIRLPTSPTSSLYTSSSVNGSPQLPTYSPTKKQKMTKDGAVFAKGKIKGDVNYRPVEYLDEETLREVQRYQVYPLGKIEDYSRHIPYNSEKKSFLEKTGRESFEVFQYTFKLPGEDKEYIVMWDYNIGLVRITPFFKCCKYSKTTPAKMLNMNPGLKEITHSITGGALAAQGYWMPFSCALAVCATFCSHIAGALIPIFGPSFPSLCVPPEAPEHGRMIISPSIIAAATAEAGNFRRKYAGSSSSAHTSPSSHTLSHVRDSYSASPHLANHRYGGFAARTQTPSILNDGPNKRLRLKRAFAGNESPYSGSQSDFDTNASDVSSGEAYFCSPGTPSSSTASHAPWHPRNVERSRNINVTAHTRNSTIGISQNYRGPNPLLSAIPRSSGLQDPSFQAFNRHTGRTSSHYGTCKRPRINGDVRSERVARVPPSEREDDEYIGDGEESVSAAASLTPEPHSSSPIVQDTDGDVGADKKAAWLLMQLSVQDGGSHRLMPPTVCGREMIEKPRLRILCESQHDAPRVKRRRATSM